MRIRCCSFPAALCAAALSPLAQSPPPPNYDEAKVPSYELPDPLRTRAGESGPDVETWRRVRRPELLELFAAEVYGRAPRPPDAVVYEVEAASALGGVALRKQVTLRLQHGGRKHALHLLVYLPAERSGPVPAFLALNFRGNHSIGEDPGVRLSAAWMRKGKGVVDNRATAASRGVSRSRWPAVRVVERGYALATMYYGDIDPDFDDGFDNGVHGLFPPAKGRSADDWGAIAAWAWGLSRALDYLVTDPDVDGERVAVMGHSRLGKTALWAGAVDPRFALVVSNNSGCGGAALSRRRFGETVERINRVFPHWFCANFHAYGGREPELPVDQHLLIALIAPRPVLVCSAEEDRWADPRGEFLACAGADSVYRLLGTDGLAVDEPPALGELVRSRIGYRVRPGKHDVRVDDWEAYLDFADHHGLRGDH